MSTPQSGIFALGTSSHTYLEFDLTTRGDALSLVTAMADLREPRTTLGGVNLVSGFRPDLRPANDRDLTGFVDGSENPSLLDAAGIALIPDGSPGSGGSILLLQQWPHDVARWESLPVAEQERVIGRSKPDSIEMDPKPPESHVGRTDQDTFGHIFRRNMPYGTVTDHGTMFVGFSAEQRPLQAMLESMAGIPDGVRDALTRYTHPASGAYYFVPPIDAVRRFSTPEDDEA